MGRKFGISFSAKRALGISAVKGRLSRKIGIPLSRSGRQRKMGRAMGCLVVIGDLVLGGCVLAYGVTRLVAAI